MTTRTFQIETLEWFETKASYTVTTDADNFSAAVQQAVKKVRTGHVAYDQHKHPGSNDQFGKVLTCIQIPSEEVIT